MFMRSFWSPINLIPDDTAGTRDEFANPDQRLLLLLYAAIRLWLSIGFGDSNYVFFVEIF